MFAYPIKNRFSIQTHIAVSMITLMLAIILVLTAFFAININSEMQKSAELKIKQIHVQTNTSLEVVMSGMLETCDYIKSQLQSKGLVDDLRQELLIITNSNKDISNIMLYSDRGEFLLGTSQPRRNDQLQNNLWFRKTIKSDRGVYFIAPILESNFTSNTAWVVCVATKFEYIKDDIKRQGLVTISLNYSRIAEIMEKVKVGNTGYAYIINDSGELIYHPNQQLLYSGIKKENLQAVNKQILGSYYVDFEGKNRYELVHSINNTRWRLVTVAYTSEMNGELPSIMRYFGLALIASMFIFIGLSHMLSTKISQPLRNLKDIMESSQFDNPAYMPPSSIRYTEIASLYENYNKMLSRNQKLMQQIIVEQDQKRLYELNALQAQINPHFLYNTLDSIIWMEERGKSSEAVQMTSALAKLFRISISRGKSVISVSDEIEHVRNYLFIQSIRFSSRFSYNINVADNAKNYKTLKLIVQPIVENAIQHGFDEYIVDDAIISLCCYIEQNCLVFKISDNGKGMARDMLETILSEEKSKRGIGVKNVHQRIQLVFGKQYGIKIQSEEDEGTTVYIRQPLIALEDEVDA